jgi:sec-independent protein translocase protein TatA
VFNIGPLELLVVLIIALIVLGPARLPEVARSVGRGMREFRNALDRERDDDDYDEPDEYDPDDRVDELEPSTDESATLVPEAGVHDPLPEAGAEESGEADYQNEADSSASSSSSSDRV